MCFSTNGPLKGTFLFLLMRKQGSVQMIRKSLMGVCMSGGTGYDSGSLPDPSSWSLRTKEKALETLSSKRNRAHLSLPAVSKGCSLEHPCLSNPTGA